MFVLIDIKKKFFISKILYRSKKYLFYFKNLFSLFLAKSKISISIRNVTLFQIFLKFPSFKIPPNKCIILKYKGEKKEKDD